MSQLPGGAKNSKRKPNELYARATRYFASGPTQAICRHVLVSEIRSLVSFFPPRMLGEEMQAYDPLPPRTTTTQYDEAYFGGIQDLYAAGSRIPRHRRPVGMPPNMDGNELANRVLQMALAQGEMEGIHAGGIPGAFEPDALEDPHNQPLDTDDQDSEQDIQVWFVTIPYANSV